MLFICSSLFGQVNLDSLLCGHWPLDRNIIDLSGKGNIAPCCNEDPVMQSIILTLVIAVFPVAASADPIAMPKKPSQRPRLKSVWAEEHQLTELMQPDTKAIVLCFLGVDCPVAQLYIPRLKEFSRNAK